MDVMEINESKMYSSGADQLVLEPLRQLHLDSICFDKLIG